MLINYLVKESIKHLDQSLHLPPMSLQIKNTRKRSKICQIEVRTYMHQLVNGDLQLPILPIKHHQANKTSRQGAHHCTDVNYLAGPHLQLLHSEAELSRSHGQERGNPGVAQELQGAELPQTPPVIAESASHQSLPVVQKLAGLGERPAGEDVCHGSRGEAGRRRRRDDDGPDKTEPEGYDISMLHGQLVQVMVRAFADLVKAAQERETLGAWGSDDLLAFPFLLLGNEQGKWRSIAA